MLDTCMILLNTCKISSCGLLTIKALSEKDELPDMMSNKTLVEEHQISGASELLTLGFLSPTSSEGKNCKNQEALSVLAGWVWWEGIIWGSCIAFRALERNFCHCKRTPTSMEGAERLSVVPKVESFSSFPMSLSSCSSACIFKKRKKKHHKLNIKSKSLRKHPLVSTCTSVSGSSCTARHWKLRIQIALCCTKTLRNEWIRSNTARSFQQLEQKQNWPCIRLI